MSAKKQNKSKRKVKVARAKRSRSEASANLKKAKAAAKSDDKPAPAGGVRSGSKLEIVAGLLTREQGCTGKEILAATGWPTVSVPQQAKAAGLSLSKEKIDGVTRYRGVAKAA